MAFQIHFHTYIYKKNTHIQCRVRVPSKLRVKKGKKNKKEKKRTKRTRGTRRLGTKGKRKKSRSTRNWESNV